MTSSLPCCSMRRAERQHGRSPRRSLLAHPRECVQKYCKLVLRLPQVHSRTQRWVVLSPLTVPDHHAQGTITVNGSVLALSWPPTNTPKMTRCPAFQAWPLGHALLSLDLPDSGSRRLPRSMATAQGRRAQAPGSRAACRLGPSSTGKGRWRAGCGSCGGDTPPAQRGRPRRQR